MQFIEKIKEKIAQKYNGSVINRFNRHYKALYLYYKHVWKLSNTHACINSFFKSLFQTIVQFNILNSFFSLVSFLFEKLGLKNISEKVKYFMQEPSEKNASEMGVNRYVLVRYLMKELFLYFFIAFLFFFMVFFVNQILLVAENILKKRVPLFDVVRLISYSLPMIIAQSAPFATLVGFLMCLGRLATDNEVLILRASGQSYKLILIPVLVLGLLISIGSFFVNDYLLPLGTIKYNHLLREIATSNPAIELESNSVKRTNNRTLVIGSVNGDNVSDLVFFDIDNKGQERIIISNESVVKKSDEKGVLMKLFMNNSIVIFFDGINKKNYDYMVSDSMILNMLESSFDGEFKNTTPREMTSFDLYKKIKEMEKKKNFTKTDMNKHKLEFHKKFSMPFGSIFFAILALPLALLFGKHNGQSLGLIIGLFISVFYWAISIVGQIFSSKTGMYGSIVMWLPNILIGMFGIFFLLKLLKK